MVYFLGREVAVYFNTEQLTADSAINISAAVAGTISVGAPSATAGLLFADDLQDAATLSTYTQIPDVTGVDISIGATDEDITYIGQKGTGKVEIKKEMTISVTRKKKNNLWDTIFNGPNGEAETGAPTDVGARWGVNAAISGWSTAADSKVAAGLINPKDQYDQADTTDVGFGYRVSIQIGNQSATGLVMSFPCCAITSYSTSLNADGVTEETMEFSTQQSVLYGANGVSLNKTLINRADF